MASQKKMIKEISEMANLSYCKNRAVAYGNFKGFVVAIYSNNTSRNQNITISLCGSKQGGIIQPSGLAFNGMPGNVKISADKFRLFLTVPVKGSVSDMTAVLFTVLCSAASAMERGGYVNCDELGVVGMSEVYLYQKSNYSFLSQNSAIQIQASLLSNAKDYEYIEENYFLGTVGALLGAIIGMVLVLIVARFGFVSLIAGIIMGCLIVYFYKKFGKKFTLPGFVISTIIAIVMTYLAFRLDIALSLYLAGVEMNFEFKDVFLHAKEICQIGGELDTYYWNLVELMLTSVGGAIIVGWVIYSSDKNQFDCVALKDL